MISGAEIMVKCLQSEGVSYHIRLSGRSNLPVL